MAPALDTYLDGELSAAQIVEVETHLNQCTSCRERVALDRAMRSSLRKVVPLRAPSSLRERMAAAMAAERERQRLEPVAPAAETPVAPTTVPTTGGQVIAFCRHDSSRVPRARACGLSAPPVMMALTRPEEVAAAPTSEPSSNVTSLEEHRAQRPFRARYTVPFAVAAAAAFAVTVHRPLDIAPSVSSTPKVSAASMQPASLGLDGIVDELVSMHAQPLPPEVTQPDEVHRFDPFVGVPVEPPKLQTFGAKWVGGRMLPIRDSRTAMLQYSLAGGHRISVYVYDPRRVRPESTSLSQRQVRDAQVYVGKIRGYNVAATERRGIGYAFATDLDEPESLELVSASAP